MFNSKNIDLLYVMRHYSKDIVLDNTWSFIEYYNKIIFKAMLYDCMVNLTKDKETLSLPSSIISDNPHCYSFCHVPEQNFTIIIRILFNFLFQLMGLEGSFHIDFKSSWYPYKASIGDTNNGNLQ